MTGLTDSTTSVLNFMYQPPDSPTPYTASLALVPQQQQQQLLPPRSYPEDDVLLGLTSGSHIGSATAPGGYHQHVDGNLFSDVFNFSSEVDMGTLYEGWYPVRYMPGDGGGEYYGGSGGGGDRKSG
jgi:hypothetical protein